MLFSSIVASTCSGRSVHGNCLGRECAQDYSAQMATSAHLRAQSTHLRTETHASTRSSAQRVLARAGASHDVHADTHARQNKKHKHGR
eukprot:5679835-Pleurochrysis_carterae.AAC.1